MLEHYEHLSQEQKERAAALEIAVAHTRRVVDHLDYSSKHVEGKGSPAGDLRRTLSVVLEGKVPDAMVEVSESSWSQFDDVTMRLARWVNSGVDLRDLPDTDDDYAGFIGDGDES